MTHKGEIKLLHDGEVVKFHRYVSLTMMRIFLSRYKHDAKHLPGICSIDVCPEISIEIEHKRKLGPPEIKIPLIRPPAIYDNKNYLV